MGVEGSLEAIQSLSVDLDSVDELSFTLGDSGWVTDFRQLDRGSEVAKLKIAATESVVLMQVDLANRVHQIAVPPAGTVSFGLPTRVQAPGKMGRRPLESETITCFDPGLGLDVVSAPGFGAYTFSFEAQRISELADVLQLPDPSQINTGRSLQCYPEFEDLSRIRHFTDQFLLSLEHRDPAVLENARRVLESDFALEILGVWSGSVDVPYVSVSNRSRALKRAMEFIHSRPQEMYSVEELCRASASSISTLGRAFSEHYGVSPKQYLTAIRLSGVRRSLVNAGDTRAIGDIAAGWGFWHMSKFAADYRRMFGELPSATRARNGKAAIE